jgi:hypothetical protein
MILYTADRVVIRSYAEGREGRFYWVRLSLEEGDSAPKTHGNSPYVDNVGGIDLYSGLEAGLHIERESEGITFQLSDLFVDRLRRALSTPLHPTILVSELIGCRECVLSI